MGRREVDQHFCCGFTCVDRNILVGIFCSSKTQRSFVRTLAPASWFRTAVHDSSSPWFLSSCRAWILQIWCTTRHQELKCFLSWRLSSTRSFSLARTWASLIELEHCNLPTPCWSLQDLIIKLCFLLKRDQITHLRWNFSRKLWSLRKRSSEAQVGTRTQTKCSRWCRVCWFSSVE